MKGTVTVSAAVIEQGNGQWSLPGGRLEENERLADGVVREMEEETGLLIRPIGITRVLRYTSQRGFHVIRFNFVAQRIGGTLQADGAEILDYAWHDLARLAADAAFLDFASAE